MAEEAQPTKPVPLRLQPDFQRLRKELNASEAKFFASRSKDDEQMLNAKRDEFYDYIRAYKKQFE